MSNGRRLTRGKLSALAGCNIETIRYYERVGLLPEPPRSEGGHRLYAEDHLKRLVFVRRCREIGFSLMEIRAFLTLVDGGDYTCGEVKTLALHHLQNVRDKIADMRKLETTLAEMSAQCDGGTVPECPMIDALFDIRL